MNQNQAFDLHPELFVLIYLSILYIFCSSHSLFLSFLLSFTVAPFYLGYFFFVCAIPTIIIIIIILLICIHILSFFFCYFSPHTSYFNSFILFYFSLNFPFSFRLSYAHHWTVNCVDSVSKFICAGPEHFIVLFIFIIQHISKTKNTHRAYKKNFEWLLWMSHTDIPYFYWNVIMFIKWINCVWCLLRKCVNKQ